MSFCNRFLSSIRLSRDGLRFNIESRITSNGHLTFRQLSTGSGQRDNDDDSKVIKKRLEKAVKKIGDKIGGEDGKKAKESLMKMVSLQSEESKQPDINVMKSITSILKDLPVEVSNKMSKGMDRKLDSRTSDRQEDRSRTWKERPPRLGNFNQIPSAPYQRDSYGRESRVSGRRPQERVNYHLAEPLNLFVNKPSHGDYYSLETWKRLRDEEMDLFFRQPARNAFDEMAQLTKEGKLWTFPIDNEAGLEQEAKVPFYDHIFVDHLLEGLPDSGPVREFMDLMVIGVTNNPYITVERKHATILWYVDFFKEKEPILRECGAM